MTAYAFPTSNGVNRDCKRFYSDNSKNLEILKAKLIESYELNEFEVNQFDEADKSFLLKLDRIIAKRENYLGASRQIDLNLTNEYDYLGVASIILALENAKLNKEIKQLQLLLGRKPYWNWTDLMSFSFLSNYFIQNFSGQVLWYSSLSIYNLYYLYSQLHHLGLMH